MLIFLGKELLSFEARSRALKDMFILFGGTFNLYVLKRRRKKIRVFHFTWELEAQD